MPKRSASSNSSDGQSNASAPILDEASAVLQPLLAILAIVGPSDAPALLTQMQADLMTCNEMIGAATLSRDWQALRRASHNLTALAGTAGAEDLQRMADDLNRAAHAGDQATLLYLGPNVQAGIATISGLIGLLEANVKQT